MVYLKHLTEAIHDLILLIDQGGRTDPAETCRHVEDGTVWTWLAGQFRETHDVNFLCAFVRQEEDTPAIWEDAGLEVAFALKEGRLRSISRQNGLCLLVEMTTFLIIDGAWEKEPLA